jgi:hypothetical protein
MIIATVLKSGGEYDESHVVHLHRNLLNVLGNGTFDFWCLSDMAPSFNTIPLTENLHGWWSKLELFKPGQFQEQVFYLDLDTIVLKDFRDMFEYDGNLCLIKDFYHPHLSQTGIMLFNPEHTTKIWDLYRQYREKGVTFNRKRIRPFIRGDGPFVQAAIPEHDFFHDLWPGKVVSFKVHCRKGKKFIGFPEDAAIVCFHGQPRPWETGLYYSEEDW